MLRFLLHFSEAYFPFSLFSALLSFVKVFSCVFFDPLLTVLCIVIMSEIQRLLRKINAPIVKAEDMRRLITLRCWLNQRISINSCYFSTRWKALSHKWSGAAKWPAMLRPSERRCLSSNFFANIAATVIHQRSSISLRLATSTSWCRIHSARNQKRRGSLCSGAWTTSVQLRKTRCKPSRTSSEFDQCVLECYYYCAVNK